MALWGRIAIGLVIVMMLRLLGRVWVSRRRVGSLRQRSGPEQEGTVRRAHDEREVQKELETSTEELRRGLMHYRALFEELLSPSFEEPARA